jgi:hypothetical protein
LNSGAGLREAKRLGHPSLEAATQVYKHMNDEAGVSLVIDGKPVQLDADRSSPAATWRWSVGPAVRQESAPRIARRLAGAGADLLVTSFPPYDQQVSRLVALSHAVDELVARVAPVGRPSGRSAAHS